MTRRSISGVGECESALFEPKVSGAGVAPFGTPAWPGGEAFRGDSCATPTGLAREARLGGTDAQLKPTICV